MSLYFFGDNFYKIKETFKIFSTQILKVYRILLVETTLESIIFYYTFSVINTTFVPSTALLLTTRTLKLSTTLLSISCGIRLISLLMTPSLVCGLLRWRLISRTEHVDISRITPLGTDSFRVKPIAPGNPIPKISTRLTIF